MNINFTVFIQVFHFFVAYVILEKFFLRPAYQSLLAKNAQENNLHARIATLKNELHAQEALKNESWMAAQKKFTQAIPELSHAPSTYKIQEPLVTVLPEEQQEYQQALETRLLQRLKNVSH